MWILANNFKTRLFVMFMGLGILFSLATPSTLQAQDNSKIEILQFDFVELKGRAGHQGLFPISGEPVLGSPQQVSINLAGNFQTSTFHFTSADGATILQNLNLENASQVLRGYFTGTAQLPDQPFKVAVSGIDLDGNSYFEVFPKVFQARVVEVNFDTSVFRVDIGTTTLSAAITNHGPPENFNIEVKSRMNLATRLEPGSLYLSTGETGVFEVDITVPEDMPDYTFLKVKAVVTGTSNPDATNNSVLEFHTETLPHITIPPDISVTATSKLTSVDLGIATANKDLTPVNDAPAEGFPVGHHIVTWEVIDAAGNEAKTDQNVSITGLGLEIKEAKVKVHPSRGKLKIRGEINLENSANGINLSEEEVTLKIGSFVEILPIGSFRKKKNGKKFIYRNKNPSGITRMQINIQKSEFEATIKRIDTSTFDTLQPVIVSLAIGNDLGENAALFQSHNEMDKDDDKDKDDDRSKNKDRD